MNKEQEKLICPLCNDRVDKLVYRFHFDEERNIIEKIKKDHPTWAESDGLCSRCMDYYQTEIILRQHMLPSIGPFFPIKTLDDFLVFPTPLRVDADPRYTGKGVTICFIDSGFSMHPDLVATRNRIKLCLDFNPANTEENTNESEASWHGTMTSVVCAGDGYLSKGLYKGIASEADLVLLKVMDKFGKISREKIIEALKWVLENHALYHIRIVNLSIGDDAIGSYKDSEIDLLAESLIDAGISIVAAVGNKEGADIHPPANAPNVISVGGIDDGNILSSGEFVPYHSNFGTTADGLTKPELVAQAIWIAAPILQGSKASHEAAALFEEVPKKSLEIREKKYISPDYMHVDGTSFAAPIVTAIIAQMLQIRPELTAYQIRRIILDSTKKIPGVSPSRQGFGLIQPRKAILKVLRKEWINEKINSPFINRKKKSIEFCHHNTCSEKISLAGSFNAWAKDVLLFEPVEDGLWKIEIPMLPEGKYYYKFVLDSKDWIEDIENPFREPDGHNGFNSILTIKNN